jgi:single-stranded-DNA-specific exonuclease
LINRGITDSVAARYFMTPPLVDLDDPFIIPGMTAAVDRLMAAREANEKIVIYGDYDVDGVTATAILTRFLSEVGFSVIPRLPHRDLDGYGLTIDAVEEAATAVSLLITVDNGISAVAPVNRANELGLDVIITDHHEPPTPLPNAVAVVNPLLGDRTIPSGSLCGAGVAFKLCMAIRTKLVAAGMPKEETPNLKKLLDLVAIATVADCVPLTGDNRVMVHHGLGVLNNSDKPGLAALMASAGVVSKGIGASDIAFSLAPRLNAAGRMGSADRSLNLLLTNKRVEAEQCAAALDVENLRRRTEQDAIFRDAMERAAVVGEPGKIPALVLGSDNWRAGIIGIVAAKLAEIYHAPVALVSFEGEEGRGSARSVPGFHLARTLESVGDTLLRFGGHEQAAGFGVRRDQFATFVSRFTEAARFAQATDRVTPTIMIDSEERLSTFTRDLIEQIRALEPFGEGAPAPRFMARNISFQGAKYLGADERHVRIAPPGAPGVIGFGFGPMIKSHGRGMYDIVFEPELNRFNGYVTPQLRLVDIRPAGK